MRTQKVRYDVINLLLIITALWALGHYQPPAWRWIDVVLAVMLPVQLAMFFYDFFRWRYEQHLLNQGAIENAKVDVTEAEREA